ncbi:MAG: KUP/HAK/KT family potassium transporter [Saprospiraceae bacterium]
MPNIHPHYDLTKRLTVAGMLLTLGIIFGDIGTSPLYVIRAIIGDGPVRGDIILGSVSLIVWTLTFQTSIKYVILALRADNRGEGGIFSLFNLVRKQRRGLIYLAMVGGCAVLAEGMLTPPITVASAVEGTQALDFLAGITVPTMWITIGIITALFLIQQFGTGRAARYFGPVMLLWFLMLGILGMAQIIQYPDVLRALNPMLGIDMLLHQPGALVLLGTVFLCTTGAEALYADLGYCGRKNIQATWILVKTALIVNYLGQAAWCMQLDGQVLSGRHANPFFDIMPEWFLPIGILLAVVAAVVASQGIISGAFTLVSEAIRLDLLPKVTVVFPARLKGQLYVPIVSWLLLGGCIFVTLYFRESVAMEAAYGVSVIITMLMTTVLLANYFELRKKPIWLIFGFLIFYLGLELDFLLANLLKLGHGGILTLLFASALFALMYVWLRAKKIKSRLQQNVVLGDFLDQIIALGNDRSEPRYATNLVYLSETKELDQVEEKILYSILQTQPKRADNYWFVNIEVTDEPYTMEYAAHTIAPDDVYKINFRLGFRVEQRMNLFLKKVVRELIESEEVHIETRYHLERDDIPTGDFRFVIVQEFLSHENDLPLGEQIIMGIYLTVKGITASPENWFGLDTDSVELEKVPLLLRPAKEFRLKRIAR